MLSSLGSGAFVMSKNVLIPLQLLYRFVDLLGYWNLSNYDPVIQLEHFEVLRSLELKLRKIALRDDYSQIIRAKTELERDDARIAYLQNRVWLRYDERNNPL